MPGAVPLRPPVHVPASVHEDGLAAHGPATEQVRIEGPLAALVRADHHALEVGHGVERAARNVIAAFVAMERRVDVGAGVREQLDLADLECRARGITGARRVARQPVADQGSGKPRVCDHPVLDLVAQIDQPAHQSHQQ